MSRILLTNCSIMGGSGEASILLEGGKISKVSDRAPDAPADEVVDAGGGTVFQGLVDTHCHPFEFGRQKRIVDLRGTGNVVALRLRLQSRIRRVPRGAWVSGRGWDHELFPDKRVPTRSDIDDVSPNNPVLITRICGHIALLNSAAIEALGIADRRSGQYERGADGELTGIVKEGALEEVYSLVPKEPGMAAVDLQAAEVEAARLGLTSLHCILSPDRYREELDALVALHIGGSLSVRYVVYLPPEAVPYAVEKGLRPGPGDGQVRFAGVKIYADGSLGARTAALREPYSDDPSNSGVLRHTDEELAELVESSDRAGYQVIVHAIGDRAVEQAVGALSPVTGQGNPRRHRIEHASLVPRDLRSKLVKHSIRATVQPLFITSDVWAADRLGEDRARDLYPLRSMLVDGIVASGSSDAPVEPMSPVLGMWASMARGGRDMQEALTLGEAVSLYTTNARSNGSEQAGGLSEGSPADLTVLDSDVREMHPALLRKVGVCATIVSGNLAHCAGKP